MYLGSPVFLLYVAPFDDILQGSLPVQWWATVVRRDGRQGRRHSILQQNIDNVNVSIREKYIERQSRLSTRVCTIRESGERESGKLSISSPSVFKLASGSHILPEKEIDHETWHGERNHQQEILDDNQGYSVTPYSTFLETWSRFCLLAHYIIKWL